MKIKLKNILIVLTILTGLILNSQVLGNPDSTECDRIKDIQKEIEVIQDQMEQINKDLQECDKISDLGKKIQCKSKHPESEISNLRSQLINKKAEALSLEEDCPELYSKIIRNLDNEIKYLDALIETDELKIQIKERGITSVQLNIELTEKEIGQKERDIEMAKLRIAETIKSLYEYDSQNLVRLTLTKGSLSDLFDEVVYVNNLQESIEEVLEKLKADKIALENSKKEFEKNREALESQRQSLSSSIRDSQYLMKKREDLILITEGKQETFERILALIKKQTQQLLSDLTNLAQSHSAELFRLIEEYEKRYGSLGPWASNGVPIYLQTDYPGETLGLSDDPFTAYGCAVTSVAMVLAKYKSTITPMTLNHDVRTFSCTDSGWAFCWNSVSNYGFKIEKFVNHTYPKSLNLDNYFDGRPMVIFLNTGYSSSCGCYRGHYVVVTSNFNGKYIVHDPILSGVVVDPNTGQKLPRGPRYLDMVKELVSDWYDGKKVVVDQVIIITPK